MFLTAQKPPIWYYGVSRIQPLCSRVWPKAKSCRGGITRGMRRRFRGEAVSSDGDYGIKKAVVDHHPLTAKQQSAVRPWSWLVYSFDNDDDSRLLLLSRVRAQ